MVFQTAGAQMLTCANTSASTVGTAYFRDVKSVVTAVCSHASTKTIAWHLEGSLSTSALWYTLNAAATTSTGTVAMNSTKALCFDRVRVLTTANETTGNITTKWWLAAR